MSSHTMRHRPWPIVIIALSQIYIEPITNVLLGAWLSRMSPWLYVSDFARRGEWTALLFTIVLPIIMGLSVWMMKRWSYPVFIAGSAWGLYGNFQTWREDPTSFPIYYFLPLFVLNLAIVSYFYVPNVRRMFFDARLRLWETPPRYQVDWVGELRFAERGLKVAFRNVSVGGAFVEFNDSRMKLGVGDRVSLRFGFLNQAFDVEARVAHSRGAGYGLQFLAMDRGEKSRIEKVISILDQMGYPGRPDKYLTPGNFVSWLNTAITEQKGIVPELPPQTEIVSKQKAA